MGLKTFIGTAIMSLGIAGVIFVAQNSAPQLNQNSKNAIKNNNLLSDKPFVEQVNGGDFPNLPNSLSNENLTEIFTKGIGKTIAQNNLPGPQNLNGQNVINAPDAEAIANNLIQEAAQKFNPADFIPEIKNSDLKISKENTKEAFLAYSKAFDQIIIESRGQIQMENSSQFTSKNLDQIIDQYKKAVKKLYELSVPEPMAGIHKTEIKYLSAELILLEKIKDAEKDPLGAILASENLPQLEEELLKETGIQFQEFLKAVNPK